MGVNLSLYDQAQKLGNPEVPVHSSKKARGNLFHGLSIIEVESTAPMRVPQWGTSVFGYLVDSRKFDTGHLLVVQYEWNSNEPQCLENYILSIDGMVSLEQMNDALPDLLREDTISSYITIINFRTEKGIRRFEPVASFPLGKIPYNDIPTAIDIPRAPISDLLMPEEFSSKSPYSAVVKYNGQLYLFRHHGAFPTNGSSTWDDTLLCELMSLSKISSPFILPASYIVTGEGDLHSKFRGFLLPFAPAGSLINVIAGLKEWKNQANRTESQLSAWNTSSETIPSVSAQSSLVITWSTKRKWAIEAASALATLHRMDAYVGTISLKNFVLGRDGCLRMVNIRPRNGEYNLYTAPPEVEDGLNLALSGPRDIFSLGLVFWMLVEETTKYERYTTRQVPRVTWHGGPNGAPQWFRILVEKCLDGDPSRRPSASSILSTLAANRDPDIP